MDEAQRGREEKEGGGIGSRGRGGVLGVGDDNGWGPNDRTADAPPSRFQEGGPLLPPIRGCTQEFPATKSKKLV